MSTFREESFRYAAIVVVVNYPRCRGRPRVNFCPTPVEQWAPQN